jgi:uncharacterized protein
MKRGRAGWCAWDIRFIRRENFSLRIRHLETLKTRTVIIQGERDPFGSPGEVSGYPLSSRIAISWVADGDHSFKPRKRSGRTEQQNLEEVVALVANFISSLESKGG